MDGKASLAEVPQSGTKAGLNHGFGEVLSLFFRKPRDLSRGGFTSKTKPQEIPMDKEEALKDFLKGLRTVLNNASSYSKDHPYFVKSVEDFKQKLDILFTFLNPIKINITPDSLFLDGRYWEKQILYEGLAAIFHLRKIKAIEFRQGLIVEELINFLSQVSLPIKEVLKRGGIKNILIQGKSSHLYIEELDYSELLQGEGEESKDVWVFLFKTALKNEDVHKINELADNFEKSMRKLQAKDLLEDGVLRQSLHRFLMYLKDSQSEKFYKYSREVFNAASKYKELLEEENLDKLKELFRDFSEENLANMLWSQISTNDSFDTLSFKLFSRITGEEKEKGIASTLLNTVINKELLKDNSKAVKNLQGLLATSGDEVISEVYRNTLSSLLKKISFGKGVSFDRDLLHMNYRFIIISLLDEEKNKERISLIVEKASKELEVAIKERDFEYLKYLFDVIKRRKKEGSSLIDILDGLDISISKFVESSIWEDEAVPELEYLRGSLERISLDADFYLNKIFVENKANIYALKLFFRFFPTALPPFYKNLKERHSNIELLEKIIKILAAFKSPLSTQILKHIFSFANEFIKIDALKAMGEVSYFDEEFLFSVLRRGSFDLKKEALIILTRNDKTKKSAIEELFCFGWKRNKTILQNLMIVEEIELKEASDYLASLSRRPFFWNRNIRKKAQEILRKWNVGRD